MDVVINGPNERAKGSGLRLVSIMGVNTDGHINSESHLVDTNGNRILIDEVTRALTTVAFEHHEIHEGDHYFCTRSQSIANAADFEFVFVTPNTTKWVHMILFTTTTGEATIDFFEGISADADGTAVNPPSPARLFRPPVVCQ